MAATPRAPYDCAKAAANASAHSDHIVIPDHPLKGPCILTSDPADTTTVDPRLDGLILECAEGEWRKVAMLIARVTDAARALPLDVTTQAIATRIYAMTSDRRLEVQGNVRRWRAAEVRKPPTSA